MTVDVQTPIRQVSGQPLQQVFDVSYNNMSGNLPNFMAKGNLQTWVSSGIYLQVSLREVLVAEVKFVMMASWIM